MDAPAVIVLGLSHRTAPIAVLERYAFSEERATSFLKGLVAQRRLGEAVLLGTCNRTEIYSVAANEHEAAQMLGPLSEALAQAADAHAAPLGPHLYFKIGADAVRHLFRVASSLDSLVLGEPQITGQVKDAYRLAAACGSVGPVLSRLFEKAFKVAKDVRSATGLGAGTVSVGSVAVDLARRVHGDLASCKVLLLGAGKMAEAAAKALAAAGAAQVVVANRTWETAHELATRYGWRALALDGLADLVAAADVVIASVSAPGYLLDRSAMKAVQRRRQLRPIILVDIGVPRALDPQLHALEGVYLYDLDDLNQIIKEHAERRAQDARQADVLVERGVQTFERYLRSRELEPLIAALAHKASEVREREVDRALRKMGELNDAQRQGVLALAAALVGKLIHDPVTALRQSAGDEANLSEAFRRLYRLGEPGDADPSLRAHHG